MNMETLLCEYALSALERDALIAKGVMQVVHPAPKPRGKAASNLWSSKKRLWRERRKQDLCGDCGEPAASGSRCASCDLAWRTAAGKWRARRYAERRAKGLCVMCATPSTTVRCEACAAPLRASGRASQARLRAKRKQQGQCVSCGVLVTTKFKRCEACREKYNASRRKRETGKVQAV